MSRKCVKSEDRDGLNTTMTMVDAAINFMCHNSGDRMALFMAEKGVECLTEHQEQVYPFWKHLNLSMDKLKDLDVSLSNCLFQFCS